MTMQIVVKMKSEYEKRLCYESVMALELEHLKQINYKIDNLCLEIQCTTYIHCRRKIDDFTFIRKILSVPLDLDTKETTR